MKRKLLAFFLILFLMVTFNMPAFGVTQSEVEEQQRQIDETNRQLQEAINRYDEASNRLAQVEREIDENKASLYKTGEDLGVAVRILNRRARGIYKHGDISALEVIFNSKNLFDFVQRLDLLTRIGESDAKLVRHVEATKRNLEAKGAELSAKEKEQETLTAQVEAEKNRIEMDLALKQGVLVGLQAELERIRGEEAARRRRPVGPINISGFVFPVWGPHEVYDDFEEPRPGHLHQGNDIWAPEGTPCVACVNGVVSAVYPYDGNAGNHLRLTGNDGTVYVYMHLLDFEVSQGTYVQAGEVVGYVGATGTDSGWPHLHFEIHPGGGSAIDPYPILKAAE